MVKLLVGEEEAALELLRSKLLLPSDLEEVAEELENRAKQMVAAKRSFEALVGMLETIIATPRTHAATYATS